ncbi:hypothetical protein [Streptomyces sp. HPF1205]|uniref:hypothetical protein n=1 Tax=Streptomyces sp. HPF1205 TaxID=2873262 RepID=UPI001CED33B8|nr:hypothetical protein [Streptomyces sp. HPF1205]
MSRSADIDLSFARPVTVGSLIHQLGSSDWKTKEPLGVSFMIEDDGDFDWQRGDPENSNAIIASLDAVENVGLHVGVAIYCEAAETGGSLLFFPGRKEVSFMPNINRKPLIEGSNMTDIPWYLSQLVPPLLTIGLNGYEARDLQD